MLTIQPNISHSSKLRAVSFKGETTTNVLSAEKEDALFKDKIEFYEKQLEELDNSLNDKKTPELLRKIMKGFKIVSEGLLEGWAVAWGASKGSRVVKSTIVKSIEKEGSKAAQEVLTPFAEKVKIFSSKIFGVGAKGAKYIKNTPLATKISEGFSKVVNKMRDNKVGKYIVKSFEYIGNFVSNKIIKPLKGVNASEMYDKAAKATSTTLGVGAGAAGAYNATGRPEQVKKEILANHIDYDDYDDYGDFDEDGLPERMADGGIGD